MKPKFDVILDLAIRQGIELGWNRAYKHEEYPDRETILSNIEREIHNSLSEYFDFPENSF